MLKIRLFSLVALPLALGLAACSSGTSDTDTVPEPSVTARDTAEVGVPAGVTQAPPADTAAVAARDTAAKVAGYQPSGVAGTPHTLNLTAVNNSGFTGTAALTDIGSGKVKVTLTLNGPSGGEIKDHDAHFHSGTCAAPGPIVHELTDVRADGTASDTEITASMTALMDGNHIVQVHLDNGAPIACAAVSKGM